MIQAEKKVPTRMREDIFLIRVDENDIRFVIKTQNFIQKINTNQIKTSQLSQYL